MSGLTRSATGAGLPSRSATWLSTWSSSALSTLNARIPASSAASISTSVFPTPAKTMSSGEKTGREAPVELSPAHDIGSSTEGPEPAEDLQIGVGFDRISEQKIHARKGRLESAIRGFDHAGRIRTEANRIRRPDRQPCARRPTTPRRRGKGLSHGHAVLIGVSTLSPTRPPW